MDTPDSSNPPEAVSDQEWRQKPASFWRERLTKEQFAVCRKKGTEKPFVNALHDRKDPGTYSCVCCGATLFDARTKYDSGTGWPSFFQPREPSAVREAPDYSLFRRRTEVLCQRCDSHLGHVFTDGPRPTGLRYCLNSVALRFDPDSKA